MKFTFQCPLTSRNVALFVKNIRKCKHSLVSCLITCQPILSNWCYSLKKCFYSTQNQSCASELHKIDYCQLLELRKIHNFLVVLESTISIHFTRSLDEKRYPLTAYSCRKKNKKNKKESASEWSWICSLFSRSFSAGKW